MSFELKKIRSNILHVIAPTAEELASIFVRFQEHYENPVFRNQIFTLGLFRKWYSQQYGGWTYAQDWTGFNLPSDALESFRKGLFDPLTKDEKKLMDQIRYRTDKFYLIGTIDGDEVTLDHELCHADFYLKPAYGKEVASYILSNSKELEPLQQYVSSKMYHPAVIIDEMNAYAVTEQQLLKDEKISVPNVHLFALMALRKKYQ